jgi:hypothetical protein
MIGKFTVLLSCVGLLLQATQESAAQMSKVERFDLARDIGLFAANQDGKFCLSIKHDALKPGREVTLIWTAVEGEPSKPEVRRARITAKLAAPCDEVNRSEDDSTYRLAAGQLEKGKVYVALVGRLGDLRIIGNQVRGRLGTTRDVSFRSCTSMEGLHFTLWSGAPPREKRLWHGYYYLGYDVEPTCREREFQEASQ